MKVFVGMDGSLSFPCFFYDGTLRRHGLEGRRGRRRSQGGALRPVGVIQGWGLGRRGGMNRQFLGGGPMAFGIAFRPETMDGAQYDECIRRLEAAGAGAPV